MFKSKLFTFLGRVLHTLRTFGAFLKERAQLAVVALAVALALAFAPVNMSYAASFNISMSGLMDTAADIFNGIWPAFAIIAGLTLGFLILKFVLNAIKGAFSGG